MPKSILVDTGSWIALFDAREEHHLAVSEYADLTESLDLVFPWPMAYEALRHPIRSATGLGCKIGPALEAPKRAFPR